MSTEISTKEPKTFLAGDIVKWKRDIIRIPAEKDDLNTSPLLPRFFPAEVLCGITGFRRGMKNLCFFGVFSQSYWAENGDGGSNPAGRTIYSRPCFRGLFVKPLRPRHTK